MAAASEVVIVTGAAGGIGRAIVEALAGDGWSVLATDLAVAIEREGAPAVAAETAPLDVRSDEDVAAAVAVAASLGPLAGVVNCAGLLRQTRLDGFADADLALMWDVNVVAMARVCRAAAAAGTLRSVVNVGSISSRLGRLDGAFGYGATKAAVESLSRALACELAAAGTRVNAVVPGYIEVPMSAAMAAISGGEETAIPNVPLGRMGQPHEVAAATAFLLSERASYITGSSLIVDGGVTAA